MLAGMTVREGVVVPISLKGDRVGRLVMEVMVVMGRATRATSLVTASSVLVRGDSMAQIATTSKVTIITMMAAAGLLIMVTMVLVDLL